MQQENKVIVKLNCFPGPCRTGENRVSRFFVSDRRSSVRSKIGRCRITTFRQNTDFNVGLTPDLHAKHHGFTLIELLVVVLIIGILAAVAVPQYQKAVDKTHMMAGITLLDSLHKAQESYYLSHGSYAARMEELDIDFPPRGCVISGNFNNAFFCPQHSIYVYNTTNSPTQESNPGGIGILYCPGETVAENCATNKNGAQWYIEHHVLEEYRNRIICGSQPRAQMLCTYVKKLANK